jgi:hypothetical protein
MRIFIFIILSLACQCLYGQNSRGQLLPYKENYKWGYINFSGEVLIPATFDQAGNFEGEFAVVKTDGKSGMISSSGKQLIPCMYRTIKIFKNNLIVVREKESWGMVDSTNVILIPQVYESIELLNFYSLKLKQNLKYGLYQAFSGKIIPCGYDTITLVPFEFFQLNRQGKIGLADSSLNIIIEPVHEMVRVERAGILFRDNGFWGVYNKSGKMGSRAIWKNYKVVSMEYLMLQDGQTNLWALYSRRENKIITKPEFTNFDFLTPEIIIVTSNGKKGLVHIQGKVLLDPIYDEFILKKNFIYIRSGKKWGLADLKLKILHEPAWNVLADFKNNLAMISSENNFWGFINAKGKVLAEPKYSNFDFADLTVKCYVNDQMDLITYDEQGNFVDKTTYKNVKTLQIGGFKYEPLNSTNNSTRNASTTDTFSLILRTQPYSYPANARSRASIKNYIKEIRARYGMYDRVRKKLLVKTEKWDLMLEDFRSGPVARIIEEGGRFGLMDRRGITKMDFTIRKNLKPSREKISYIGNFSQELARINLGGALNGTGSGYGVSNIYSSTRMFILGCSGGLWGFIDRNGRLAIEAKYEYVDDFHYDRAIVKINGKFGVINMNNEFVIKPEYDEIDYLPNSDHKYFSLYFHTPRYGVIDEKGKILVPLKYESLGNWKEGLTVITQGGKSGFMNVDGEIVLPVEYEKVKEFSEGLAAVKKEKKWGYIDLTGNFVIEPAFSSAGNFQNGLAPVTSRKGNGYVNQKGEVTYSKYSKCFEYNKGMAKVRVKGKLGFIDEKGKWLVHPHYNDITDFNKYNLAIARKGRKFGLIDRNGKHVTHLSYQKIGPFSEGYASIQKKNKYGFIDSSGKVIIEPQYFNAGKFSEGVAAVNVLGRWGYITSSNKMIVNPKYRKAGEFVENLAQVKDTKGWGFINKTGSEIIPLKYSYVSDFKNGIALAGPLVNYATQFITKEGKVLFDSTYQQAMQFEDGIARVKKYGKWGLINKDGANVVEYKYDGIQSFSDKKAVVMIRTVEGIADLEGKILANPEFQKITFVRGYFCLEKSDEVGYLKTNGTWLWEPKK